MSVAERLRHALRGEPRQAFVETARDAAGLPYYRIDFSGKLGVPDGFLDERGVPCDSATPKSPAAYHATTIGQYALAHWNAMLASGSPEVREGHRRTFTTQARWLVANRTPLPGDSAGWPIPYRWPDWHAPGPWLSALTQGIGVSVLVRAHRLTGEPSFREVAAAALTTFERDILDGGVRTPLGDGACFEEVAVYPAGHILNGHLFALLGLRDWLALTGEARAEALLQAGLRAVDGAAGAYDTGWWSRYDLLHRHLAPPFYHALHVAQLRAMAELTGSVRCRALSEAWDRYQSRASCRARQLAARQVARGGRVLGRLLRPRLFPAVRPPGAGAPERVLVPVTAFPITGGIRAVLAGIAEAMDGRWRMEHLARDVGPHGEEVSVRRFGTRAASPWHFPTVWLYAAAAAWRVARLLRSGPPCRLVLPQDSVFTGALTALAGRLAGARVVCVEHGTVTFPHGEQYLRERAGELPRTAGPARLLARAELALYLRSLRVLARLTARLADHFLVAGDESAEVYVRTLGVRPHRISRWRFAIDAGRYAPPDAATRARRRARLGLATDAVVVSIIARLDPAKGLDVALEGIELALARLPAGLAGRVRVLIAGDGPLRGELEADLRRRRLEDRCRLLGETPVDAVIELLGISDVFLYTSRRGTNFSMAVLEAMAAGCAVIATTEPVSNRELLAEGRGYAIPSEDAEAVAGALAAAVADPGREAMGRLARRHVAERHGAEELRRTLLRACFWSADLGPRRPPA